MQMAVGVEGKPGRGSPGELSFQESFPAARRSHEYTLAGQYLSWRSAAAEPCRARERERVVRGCVG